MCRLSKGEFMKIKRLEVEQELFREVIMATELIVDSERNKDAKHAFTECNAILIFAKNLGIVKESLYAECLKALDRANIMRKDVNTWKKDINSESTPIKSKKY